MQRSSFSRVFLVVLACMLCAAAVHAASYRIELTPVKDSIRPNESASFDVDITNFDRTDVSFQVYTVDPQWIIKTEPLDLTVGPASQKTFHLYLRPTQSASEGTQGVTLTFKELGGGEAVPKSVYVSLTRGESAKFYAPTVYLDLLMPYDIDPRNAVPMRLELRNSNQLNISNLTILINSPHFNRTEYVTLRPLSEKTKDIEGLSIPLRTLPGEAEVTVQLVFEDVVIRQIVKNYRIKDYTQVTQRVHEDSFFFRTEKQVEITNEGNVRNNAIVSVPTSFVKSLFISSNLPYESEVRDSVRVVFWSIPLDPYETRTFTYTENYRILVLLFLLAVVGAIVYLLLRSPVVAVKEAVAIAQAEGVSDIKVRVFVKNRSARLVQGIQVTDRVPSLADVIRSDAPGSIPPSKMAVNEKHGTMLRWDLDVLEPFEERVLTYRVKSKLKIIGRMRLPNARIRFTMNNRERMIYSNNIELVEKFKDR